MVAIAVILAGIGVVGTSIWKVADVLIAKYGVQGAEEAASSKTTCITALESVGRADLAAECFKEPFTPTVAQVSPISQLSSMLPLVLIIAAIGMVRT